MEEPYSRLVADNQFEEIISLPNIEHSNDVAGSKSIRLRAVETEAEIFLKLMQISLLRNLIIIQGVFSALIVVLQLSLYSVYIMQRPLPDEEHYYSNNYWKLTENLGIGIWGPLLFFSTACGLSFVATKRPSGCILGTALGFQIVANFIGALIIQTATISIGMHGYYTDQDNELVYNHEASKVILCSFMILSTMAVILSAFFISVQFCKATCCGQLQTLQSGLYDVESNK